MTASAQPGGRREAPSTYPHTTAGAAALFAGPGELRALCRALDWSVTPLGPVETWPVSLRTTVAMLLAARHPMILFWGPERVQLYNDAYVPTLGPGRHPAALGMRAADCWRGAVWDIVGPQLDHVVATGVATWHEDQAVPLPRHGTVEETYWTYSYGPAFDDAGRVAGVLVVTQETTARVVGERERRAAVAALAAERDRLRQAFDQAPGFVAVLRGPEHRYEYVNGPYAQMAGHRPLVGRSVREAFPDLAGQGFYELLDRVYATGEPFAGTAVPIQLQPVPGGPAEARRIDLIYQPLTEPGDATGARDSGASDEAAAYGGDGRRRTGLRVTGILVQGRDVTAAARDAEALGVAAREHERLLAESEAARDAADLERRRLAALLEQLPVGVSLAEAPGGRLLVSNPAIEHIWGTAAPSEGVDHYSADYTGYRPPDGPHAGRRYANDEWPLARALATGEVVTDEVVDVERPDGSRVTVSLSAAPVRDADGRIVGGVVTSLDVTERERLLAAERAAAGRVMLLQALAAAFNAALTPEAVVHVLLAHGVAALGATTGLVLLLSADGTHLTCAGAHGYPPGFAARFDAVPLDAALPIAAAVREGRPVWVEDADAAARAYPDLVPIYAATGSGATAALPLADLGGRVIGALAFNYATSRTFDAEGRAFKAAVAQQCAQALERARLFAAERAARAEAEAANAAKSQFLATMSHELRTPLNAIGGYVELIELGIRGPVTPEQRTDLEKIQRSQRHLLGLINGVLNYARVEAGAVHYDLADVLLDEVLATCEALTAPQVRAKGLTLRHDACDRTLRVRADREKLQQVVLNLLSNAVKFTEPGGRVTLACAGDAAAVRVAVADTGIGIARDQLARVFEPFVQVDARLTRTQEGTGLGLAISRDLARGMGGDLTAESAPGAGSTFTLTLPAA
ncbi:hypothetical protein tb265_11560 [Gemmatimonadetes bacterium T265]|nr:hypothetical protein tb265_11560 [Gemmatimonadetes bacterium T265]